MSDKHRTDEIRHLWRCIELARDRIDNLTAQANEERRMIRYWKELLRAWGADMTEVRHAK